MFNRRSPLVLISSVLGLVYASVVLDYLMNAPSSALYTDFLRGTGLAMVFAWPHVLTAAVGSILGLVGFFRRSTQQIFASSVLFSAAAAVYLVWAVFLVPSIILGFLGNSSQKKINGGQSDGS